MSKSFVTITKSMMSSLFINFSTMKYEVSMHNAELKTKTSTYEFLHDIKKHKYVRIVIDSIGDTHKGRILYNNHKELEPIVCNIRNASEVFNWIEDRGNENNLRSFIGCDNDQ